MTDNQDPQVPQARAAQVQPGRTEPPGPQDRRVSRVYPDPRAHVDNQDLVVHLDLAVTWGHRDNLDHQDR